MDVHTQRMQAVLHLCMWPQWWLWEAASSEMFYWNGVLMSDLQLFDLSACCFNWVYSTADFYWGENKWLHTNDFLICLTLGNSKDIANCTGKQSPDWKKALAFFLTITTRNAGVAYEVVSSLWPSLGDCQTGVIVTLWFSNTNLTVTMGSATVLTQRLLQSLRDNTAAVVK